MTLKYEFSITEENTHIDFIGVTPAKNALLDGRVDAIID